MLSDDDKNAIRRKAEDKMHSALSRLNPPDSSETLADAIAKAIAAAIEEYDRLKSQ